MRRLAPLFALVLLAACAPAADSMTILERQQACEARGCVPSCSVDGPGCASPTDDCAGCEPGCFTDEAVTAPDVCEALSLIPMCSAGPVRLAQTCYLVD